MQKLLPFFIVIPIIEMVILIEVGQWLGVIPTIGLVLLTAVLGLNLLRQQGFATLLKANQKMEQGGLPAEEMLEGLLLAIGGALLLTPGFFTDAIGFYCLLPFTRQRLVKQMIAKGVFMAAQQGNIYTQSYQKGPEDSDSFGSHQSYQQRPSSGDVIEGEFDREK